MEVERKEDDIFFFSKLPASPAPDLSSVLIKGACQTTRHQTVYSNIARGHENTSVTAGPRGTQVEHLHIHTDYEPQARDTEYGIHDKWDKLNCS
jgi:hypothetical protein